QTAGAYNRYHDACDCQPMPYWQGQGLPYDPDELYSYYLAAREVAGGDTRAILAQLRKDLGIDGGFPPSGGLRGVPASRMVTGQSRMGEMYVRCKQWRHGGAADRSAVHCRACTGRCGLEGRSAVHCRDCTG